MSLSALGPFVMNTNKEISQAILDFRNAKNGFERAKTWKSKIGNQWRAQEQENSMEDIKLAATTTIIVVVIVVVEARREMSV